MTESNTSAILYRARPGRFTAVELVDAVVVAIILIAVAMPVCLALPYNYRLDGAPEQLPFDIRAAYAR